ncbi:PulJ/GspJ family protein [Caenimonas aquaedulcis]|uniref:Prepilin-type N-terminal cleavage/methylation domain-containing protein n=1 Tax=Caenimonas aquaedulcis TaxID=2793270 RepID=A0A931MHR5_9BURK|nr:prepilin-type N-terminal cleavage/methylation domain-containing protein [Caenimonas aquaedulcis]MBG9389356.1 prepilin-type N-terminal cleavage/methylation domain-containing protein [Caenimonas aquaedulcis]
MRRRGTSGFTLIELLVALFVMALLAILSWRGLDGMTRAQAQTEARADGVLALQVGLAQWDADLDALQQVPQASAIEWNGRVLRMTRRSTASATDGVLVVAWTRRAVNGVGTWLRWQSAPVVTRGDLQAAWAAADAWSQSPGEESMQREVAIVPLDEWQIYFFRENAWTNPLSSDVKTAAAPAVPGAPAVQAAAVIPDGVRLVLTLPGGQPITGTLSTDWVRPTVGGSKG